MVVEEGGVVQLSFERKTGWVVCLGKGVVGCAEFLDTALVDPAPQTIW